MESPTQFRPMSIGDILDATFKIYLGNFVTFMGIIGTLLLLYIFIGFCAFFLITIGTSGGNDAMAAGAVAATVILVLGLMALAYPLIMGAMIQTVSASFLGNRIGAIQAYRRAFPRLLNILFSIILMYICMVIGFFFFIIGMFIVLIWLCLTPTVAALEDEGVFGSLGRSFRLIKGNFWKALGLLFIVGVLVQIISYGVQFAVLPLQDTAPLLGPLIIMAVGMMLMPIQIIPTILLYYDMRIRKEGFDMEMLAVQLGTPLESDGGDVFDDDAEDKGVVRER